MKIALLGDIALIGRYDRTITKNVDERIAEIKEIVQNCDFIIANLESPLTYVTHTWTCKGVYLRSDPINVETLKKIGVTHVTLANNHTYDYGKKSVKEMTALLIQNGIKYVGLNNPAEKIIKGNSSVLLDGFCCLSANALNYGSQPGQVKILSPDTMDAFMKEAQKEKSLPIASVHFGLEGIHYPAAEHIRFFHQIAKGHSFVLHGNHPHAIQGYELFNDSLLIYAQGNLCFDETPITSIHYVPKETEEKRKSYISIIDIEGNTIKDHYAYGITDLPDGILHMDRQVNCELEKYVNALSADIIEIIKKRAVELKVQRSEAQKHDLFFYLNRLNWRYIGAYLNGIKHAKKYNKTFKRYYIK